MAIPAFQPAAGGVPPPFRKPKRITITIPYHTYSLLLECSNAQGRSLSNLAAFLLETSVESLRVQGQGAMLSKR